MLLAEFEAHPGFFFFGASGGLSIDEGSEPGEFVFDGDVITPVEAGLHHVLSIEGVAGNFDTLVIPDAAEERQEVRAGLEFGLVSRTWVTFWGIVAGFEVCKGLPQEALILVESGLLVEGEWLEFMANVLAVEGEVNGQGGMESAHGGLFLGRQGIRFLGDQGGVADFRPET